MIYLDSNATTQPDPAVVETMLPWLKDQYANPSAGYAAGRRAHRALETARAQVAGLIHAGPEEITFTSGATESINSVFTSVQGEWPDRPRLVIGSTEHPATLESAARWQQRGGEVCRVAVNSQGLVNLDELRQAVIPGRTALVSFLWASNETGVITPMADVVEIAQSAGALIHADAVQAAGKIPLDVTKAPVDYLSLSGHKMHAPKGIGALFVSRRVAFRPLIVGGGQESGRRSGTENVPGIVAMGRAAELASLHLSQQPLAPAEPTLRDALELRLLIELPGTLVHGSRAPRLPNTSSLCFPGLDAAGLLIMLDQKGVACSGGSACHTASLHPSHVLEAMGFDAAHASSTLRLSLSRFTTPEDTAHAAEIIVSCVRRLQSLKDMGSGPVAVA